MASLLLVACFGGESVQGLPCASDNDCGPELACVDGFCGGLGDAGVCGNSLLELGEECDDGNLEDGDACTPECLLPVCGDGHVGPDEQCDDGNLEAGDLEADGRDEIAQLTQAFGRMKKSLVQAFRMIEE